MARWVVIFEDTAGMLAVRHQREPAHLAYLAANKDRILIAGGLRPAPGETKKAGQMVVADRGEAVALVENDPYYQPEHRKYRVLAWGKALDGPVVL